MLMNAICCARAEEPTRVSSNPLSAEFVRVTIGSSLRKLFFVLRRSDSTNRANPNKSNDYLNAATDHGLGSLASSAAGGSSGRDQPVRDCKRPE